MDREHYFFRCHISFFLWGGGGNFTTIYHLEGKKKWTMTNINKPTCWHVHGQLMHHTPLVSFWYSQLENFAINLSTWITISSIWGRTAAWGWSIHVTNWWSASGYLGLGPVGHFTCAFTMANCRLPPDSPSAYSNGDKPYL